MTSTKRPRIRRSRLRTCLEDVFANVCSTIDNARNSGVQNGLQRRGRHGTRQVEPRQDLRCHVLMLRSGAWGREGVVGAFFKRVCSGHTAA